MLASYRVHEISSRDALTPGLSVLRTQVFRSLMACKTCSHQTCAKTSPILLFGHAALPPRIPKQFLKNARDGLYRRCNCGLEARSLREITQAADRNRDHVGRAGY